jgi:DNA-binding MarR family transcriptional regulator
MKEVLNKDLEGDFETTSLSDTFDLIDKVNKGFKDLYRKVIHEYNLTLPQYCVLRNLGLSGGLQLRDLALKCHLSRSTMTGVIDTMERNKIVVRVKNPEDRRSSLVVLTDKGKQIYIKLPKQDKITQNCCNALNSEEIQDINILLMKMLKMFD